MSVAYGFDDPHQNFPVNITERITASHQNAAEPNLALPCLAALPAGRAGEAKCAVNKL